MKIVVADHHMIIRRGMQLIVAKRPGWNITEAADAEELFAALRRERFDVVVLDLMLRDRSAVDLIAEVRRDHVAVPVLILASYPEEQYALHALRAGARGYVQKDSTADEILEAIERVAAGRTWLSDAVNEQMAQEMINPSSRAPHELLSPREFEVFRLIAAGRSMTAIAAALGVSVKTASTYRARILEKTGFEGNADIVAYAIQKGLRDKG
ncbi:MAG TPA: response regulator transcription factor [Thermoanaerobaculia bacterium]